jgi:hypothetical protein
MPEKKFELGDYVEVKDRIAILYERFPQARIETTYELTSEPDEKPKVICRAFVYRKPEDERPAGHGTSWLYLPGATPYTRGSEIENAETWAVGRAIGMLGILIDKSIASSNEIANKQEGPAPVRGVVAAHPAIPGTLTDQGRAMSPYDGLIGKVEIAKDSPDFLPHIGPDGAVLSFKLVSPVGGIKVIAKGSLAELIAMSKSETVGVQVTCWGRISDETFTPKGTKKPITYQVLALERIKTPTYILPAIEDALPEPPEDVSLIGEKPEAETAPLFDDLPDGAKDALAL